MTGGGSDVSRLACNELSPQHKEFNRRVRCNRLAHHSGPHRRLRAKDFSVLAEWTEHHYTILPDGSVPKDNEEATG